MPTILEMKARRADIAAQVQQLAEQEQAGIELTAEQLQQVTELQQEFTALGNKLTRAEAAEQMQAAAAQQVETLNAQGAPPVLLPATRPHRASRALPFTWPWR
jgi:Zn-dependent oligopeptidase